MIGGESVAAAAVHRRCLERYSSPTPCSTVSHMLCLHPPSKKISSVAIFVLMNRQTAAWDSGLARTMVGMVMAVVVAPEVDAPTNHGSFVLIKYYSAPWSSIYRTALLHGGGLPTCTDWLTYPFWAPRALRRAWALRTFGSDDCKGWSRRRLIGEMMLMMEAKRKSDETETETAASAAVLTYIAMGI